MKNAQEIEFWNSNAGEKWTRNQQRLDRLFSNISDRLLQLADPSTGMSVLDIGCGTGAISLETAFRVTVRGKVSGVDVSKPMLDLAIQRANEAGLANIEFSIADAQESDLGAQQFDLILSRFGVMFFDDPVAAFANILQSGKPKARTVFCAWTSMNQNPWFRIPRDTAVSRLGKPEPASPTAPGPMAFADPDYVTGILTAAGYSRISSSVQTIDLIVDGDEYAAANLGCEVGPVTRVAKENGATTEDIAEIEKEVAIRMKQYVSNGVVTVPASLNFFECFTD